MVIKNVLELSQYTWVDTINCSFFDVTFKNCLSQKIKIFLDPIVSKKKPILKGLSFISMCKQWIALKISVYIFNYFAPLQFIWNISVQNELLLRFPLPFRASRVMYLLTCTSLFKWTQKKSGVRSSNLSDQWHFFLTYFGWQVGNIICVLWK